VAQLKVISVEFVEVTLSADIWLYEIINSLTVYSFSLVSFLKSTAYKLDTFF